MLKLDYLNEYVTLVETLNYSRTAELCFITQPALSRHIASIEKEYGDMLLLRNTRSVVVTEAGEMVYASFQKILATYRQSREGVSLLSSNKTGILRLSAPYYSTSEFVEPVVSSFLQKYPNCKIQLNSAQPVENYKNLINRNCDIIFTAQFSVPDKSIRYIPFTNDRLCAIVLKGDPLAQKQHLRIEDLDSRAIVVSGQKELNTDNENLILLLSKHGVKPSAVCQTEQVETLGMTLAQTGAYSISTYITRNMNRDYLRFIPFENSDCIIPICLYYLVDNDNSLIPPFTQEAITRFK